MGNPQRRFEQVFVTVGTTWELVIRVHPPGFKHCEWNATHTAIHCQGHVQRQWQWQWQYC